MSATGWLSQSSNDSCRREASRTTLVMGWLSVDPTESCCREVSHTTPVMRRLNFEPNDACCTGVRRMAQTEGWFNALLNDIGVAVRSATGLRRCGLVETPPNDDIVAVSGRPATRLRRCAGIPLRRTAAVAGRLVTRAQRCGLVEGIAKRYLSHGGPPHDSGDGPVKPNWPQAKGLAKPLPNHSSCCSEVCHTTSTTGWQKQSPPNDSWCVEVGHTTSTMGWLNAHPNDICCRKTGHKISAAVWLHHRRMIPGGRPAT